jgi:polysaccharide chain length determinant protein (PEP-CTERM system associated)
VIPGRKYEPEEFLRLVWQRRLLVLVPLVLVTAGTLAGLRFLPDRYRSETLILVVPQRVPEEYVRSTVTTRIEDRLQSISQQILSRSRLEPIIDDFKLYPRERGEKPMEDVVEQMRRDIGVQIVKGDAFRVSYVSDQPQTAMKVTERLASLFIEENLRDREVLAESTNQFLETQLEDARRRLVEHEEKLEQYRLRHSGELPSQLASNMQAIQNLQLQVQAITESINRDRDRLLMIDRAIADENVSIAAGTPDAPAPAPEAGVVTGATPARQLENARKALDVMLLRFKPEHPDIIRMKRLIAELEAKAGATAEAAGEGGAAPAADPRTAQLRAEREGLASQVAKKEAQQQQLQRQIAAYQARLDAVPTRESELVALTRDYETLRKVYTDLLAKKEESKVAANLERRQIGEQFKILDPARLPERPFRPNRPMLTAAGAGAGLGVGLALVALLFYRDGSMKCEDDVAAALGLPVMATIPLMQSRLELRRRRLASVAGHATVFAAIACVAAYAWISLR